MLILKCRFCKRKSWVTKHDVGNEGKLYKVRCPICGERYLLIITKTK